MTHQTTRPDHIWNLRMLADMPGTIGTDRRLLTAAAAEIDRLRGALTLIESIGDGYMRKIAQEALANQPEHSVRSLNT